MNEPTLPKTQPDRHFLHPWQDVTSMNEFEWTFLNKGSSIYVSDKDGNRLLDGPGGMWCVNVGYGREEIIEAVSQQMRELSYFSPWAAASSKTTLLAEKLASLAPGDLNKVFFTTCGSTAIDSALRFAFFYNNCRGRPEKKHIISRVNAYHGSTYLTASCCGKRLEKENMDMVEDRVHFLPCPKPRDRQPHLSVEAFCDEKVADLENKILEIGPEKVAVFIAEPIFASGGVIVPPDGYFKRCHEICKKYEVLFLADEVVTAFGRLGHFFASNDVFGVTPDMITIAKGLTSGYIPMGAVLISERLLADIEQASNEPRNFVSGFTYSGHPVAAAAALANIEIFEKDNLLEHVRQITPYFEKAVQSLSDIEIITDIRVKGLMAGIECQLDPQNPDEMRDFNFLLEVDRICQENGLLVRPIYNSCVISPPLTINERQIDELIACLRHGIERAYRAI